jgi:3-hydroxyisobutyrate dehydrogenase
MKIGWIGVGRMGAPMAARLLKAHYPVFIPPTGMRKDMDLGLAIARQHEVPMPVTAATREVLQSHIGVNRLKPDGEAQVGRDFAAMFETMALLSGVRLESENIELSDGLEPQVA